MSMRRQKPSAKCMSSSPGSQRKRFSIHCIQMQGGHAVASAANECGSKGMCGACSRLAAGTSASSASTCEPGRVSREEYVRRSKAPDVSQKKKARHVVRAYGSTSCAPLLDKLSAAPCACSRSVCAAHKLPAMNTRKPVYNIKSTTNHHPYSCPPTTKNPGPNPTRPTRWTYRCRSNYSPSCSPPEA